MSDEQTDEKETENPQAEAAAEVQPSEAESRQEERREPVAAAGNTGNENVFLLKERYEVDLGVRLSEYDTNGAKAYAVKDKTNPNKELFALVCEKETPRLSYLPYMKSIDSPNILKLAEYGHITIKDAETIALIYNKPTGPRVDVFDEAAEKITPEGFKSLVLSLLSACEVLKTFGLTHRAIRLDNVFFKDASKQELVLGDCLASFPSMHQPPVYETIENILCPPQSRGNGSIDNDIYACAVVLLGLALNSNITSELSAKELIKQKLKNTSFGFLAGNGKIHNRIASILRLMLDDNAEKRCDYATIANYFEGKTVNLATSDSYDRSNKALTINGEKCYTRKSAALAILNNPDFGLEVIQSGKLLDWVKNGLENEKLANKLNAIISADKENPDRNLLIAKVVIYLDSSLPLKCGDSYIFPEGLAKTIFYNKKNNLSLTPLQNLISTDVIKLWYQEQSSMRAPSNASEFKLYISRHDMGYGFERIMYDFDEDLPCISPLLGKAFVNNTSRLLGALNNNRANFGNLPFDKTIIAYLRCKMGKKIDGIIIDVNANQDAIKVGAVIRLYATIQNKQGPAQLVNLTQWLVKAAKPVIQSYHNIKYQKYLEQELLKISKSGKIMDIVDILENEEARMRDRADFTEALKTVNFLKAEKNKILSGDNRIDEEARDLALRFSSILSVLTMLSTFVFSIIYWMVK
ncbi:MAG: protein kinase family protein [Alphaproteobacteria bacterium]|nr:protein kinase family protein [Alphaproteobacteria bacterium]